MRAVVLAVFCLTLCASAAAAQGQVSSTAGSIEIVKRHIDLEVFANASYVQSTEMTYRVTQCPGIQQAR